ncbi:unnamed protein product [Ambrosiozyma monospora]|uniref:Unnamed protein product n=1 Tax=Ambrosiozyma monospora TaxID=43982 RepID=A0ACB5SXL0_AMBMO|nr:unnamed protein product [Ambrosiozyma monospora]
MSSNCNPLSIVSDLPQELKYLIGKHMARDINTWRLISLDLVFCFTTSSSPEFQSIIYGLLLAPSNSIVDDHLTGVIQNLTLDDNCQIYC